MNKKIIPVIISIIIITISIYYITDNQPIDETITIGPITMSQSQYKLGENIFMTITGIQRDQNGEILVYTPNDILFRTIPFNGSAKSEFNQYFYPDTSKSNEICTAAELTGTWTILWNPGYYPNVEFELGPEWIEGQRDSIGDVC